MRPFVDAVPEGALVRRVRWGDEPAGAIDLDADLSGPASPEHGRHPLPTSEAFAAAMSAHGIGDGDVVVAYDDRGGLIAARLVWMLRVLGERAALLNGSPFPVAPATGKGGSVFTPRPWPPQALASLEDVMVLQAPLIDARPAERFRGDGPPNPLDPRPGHIPGARSLPALEHLDADGRLLDDAALRTRFTEAGVTGPGFISSCGSGVTACFNLLVAEHLRLGHGRLYPGSFSQYAADPARAVALG